MGLSLAPIKASPPGEPAAGYPIIDVVEVRTTYGAPAPGFIVVLGGFTPSDLGSLVGRRALFPMSETQSHVASIVGVRDHGPTASILVEHWPSEFPKPAIGGTVVILGSSASGVTDGK